MDPRNPYSQSAGYTGLLYSQHESVNDGNSPYESFPSGSSQFPQFSSQQGEAPTPPAQPPVGITKNQALSAKAKRNGNGKSVDYYTTVLELRKVDLDRKEKLQKLAILDTLLAKPEPLTEAEETAKNKLLAKYI
ncbi:hypothetical protein YC2023_111760 [Brassica napus]